MLKALPSITSPQFFVNALWISPANFLLAQEEQSTKRIAFLVRFKSLL